MHTRCWLTTFTSGSERTQPQTSMVLLPIRRLNSTTMWASVYTIRGKAHLNQQHRNLNNDIQVPFMHCYGCSGGHLSIIETATWLWVETTVNSLLIIISLPDSAISCAISSTCMIHHSLMALAVNTERHRARNPRSSSLTLIRLLFCQEGMLLQTMTHIANPVCVLYFRLQYTMLWQKVILSRSESGFNHVEPEQYTHRLLHFKGTTVHRILHLNLSAEYILLN